MVNKLKSNNIILIILVVILTISIVLNIYSYGLKSKSNINFFNDYVVAMNDYHIADNLFNLAGGNLDAGNWYTYPGQEYYYEDAIDYYDLAKEQFNEAKEFLNHAKSKLNSIKDEVPNDFYEREINNRLKQIDIHYDLVNQYFLLSNYMSKQLYEINYGSEIEATKYFNMYNDLVLEINSNLQKLSDVSQEIDLAWDQNWYPLFEGI